MTMKDNKQRILLVTRSLQMGGIERHTIYLANALAELGHEIHIFCFKKRLELIPDERVILHFYDFDKINRMTIIGLIYDILTRFTVSVFIRGSGFIWRGLYIKLYFRLFLKYFERKYGSTDKILVMGHGAFEYLWNFNDPRVYQLIVSPFVENNNPLDKWYTKLLFANKNIIANSRGVRDSLLEKMQKYHLAVKSIRVIANPCPIKNMQLLSNEEVDIPNYSYIIHVGRLTKQKNQTLLIEAYAKSEIEEKLVIIGSGLEEQKLRNLARQLKIENKVVFLGQKTNPFPWIKHAKLFVLTSLIEGFGYVNVESLACGTPVVAVDCPGGIKDILIEEQSELIAKPNPESVALKIQQALLNPPVIKPEWYEKFDSENVAKEFLAL